MNFKEVKIDIFSWTHFVLFHIYFFNNVEERYLINYSYFCFENAKFPSFITQFIMFEFYIKLIIKCIITIVRSRINLPLKLLSFLSSPKKNNKKRSSIFWILSTFPLSRKKLIYITQIFPYFNLMRFFVQSIKEPRVKNKKPSRKSFKDWKMGKWQKERGRVQRKNRSKASFIVS